MGKHKGEESASLKEVPLLGGGVRFLLLAGSSKGAGEAARFMPACTMSWALPTVLPRWGEASSACASAALGATCNSYRGTEGTP